MKAETRTLTPVNRLLFFLVISMLIWPPLAFGASRTSEQSVLLLHFLFIIIVLVLANLMRGKASVQLFPLWGVLLPLGLAVALSAFSSIHPRTSYSWMGMFAIYGFVFAWAGSLPDKRQIQTGLYILLAAAVFTALYGIWRFVFGVDAVWGVPELQVYAGRLSGTYRCPNHGAAFWALLLPVAAYLAVKKGGALRFVGIVSALVLLAAVSLSYSRSGLLTLSAEIVTAIIITALASKKHSTGVKAAAILVILVMFASAIWAVMRLQRGPESNELVWGETWQPGAGDASQVKRYGMLRDTLKMIPDRSMTGLGPGTFSVAYPAYRGEMIYTMANESHNDYLQNAAEFGLPFFILFIVFLMLILKHAYGWQKPMDRDCPEGAELLPYLLVAIAGFCVAFALDFNLRIPGNAMAFFFFAGAACRLGAAGERHVFRPGTLVYRIAGIALIVCASLLIPKVYAWFDADLLNMKSVALDERGDNEKAVELLMKARELDPGNDRYARRAAIMIYRKSKDENDSEGMMLARDQALEAASINRYAGRPFITAARAEFYLGNSVAAEKHLNEAIRREPMNAGFMDNLVYHLVKWDRKQEALPWVKRSCKAFPLWKIHYYINLEKWDPEIYAAAAEGLFEAWEERHEENAMEALMKLSHDSLKNDQCALPEKLKNEYGEHLRESLVRWTHNQCVEKRGKKKMN
ncbi:O-antigen ligase family protein [bacterium]